MKRYTVARTASTDGVGLHTGEQVSVTVQRAPSGSGRVFRRTDAGTTVVIPALASHVVGTDHRTVLASGSDTVSTVEHVLAAATAMGVDDVSIETYGPELPIGDGSAAHFVDLFERAGRIANTAELAPLIVREPFQLTHEGSHYAVDPADEFRLTVSFEMSHPLIGKQDVSLELNPASFCNELAAARTFGLVDDHERLTSAGLARGANASNVLALTESGLLEGELRWPDEFVRHKTLDLVGDLALVGRPIVAHIKADQPGHGGNVALARAFLALALKQAEA